VRTREVACNLVALRACVRDVVKVLAKGISLFLLPAWKRRRDTAQIGTYSTVRKGCRAPDGTDGLWVVCGFGERGLLVGVDRAVIEVECWWLDEACWLID
jgi:hypothetical protein